MTEPTRALLFCAAALLDQGRNVDRLSRPLTAAALIGILVYPILPGPPEWPLIGLGVMIVLAGLAESYFAIRVALDAALFHRLAGGAEAPDFASTDAALTELGLLPAAKAGRPIAPRIAGARRLFTFQALALAIQILTMVGGGFALAWR